MRRQARHDEHRRNAAVRLRRAAGLGTALAAAGLLVVGCGGNSPGSGVAHLGTGSSTTSSTAAGSAGGSASGPGSSSTGEASPGSKAIAYAACIHAHGVPNFPEPKISTSANGGVRVAQAVPASIGVGNSKFKSAQQACRKLLPAGEGSHQAPIGPQEQAQYLKAAACIRSHGVPNFPDPTFSGGGVHLDHKGLNLSSPTFLSAEQACKSLIPGGLHGSG